MTRNHKPGELPDRFSEQLQNEPDSALLVADLRLDRADVLTRIADAVDADLPSAQSGHFTHDDLARLVSSLGDDRTPSYLKRHHTKGSLAQLAVDLSDADTSIDAGQDGFRKDQAIRVWFAVAHDVTADEPDDDQDQGKGSQARVQA